MDNKYIIETLRSVSGKINKMDGSVTALMTDISSRTKDLKFVSLDDQLLLGGILASYLHQAYCDGRKLAEPLPNGLMNEPRIKELGEELDKDFVADVLSGKIPTSDTLYIENGKVFMDIANTSFTQLSPHWQYDNFNAGATAARSVITNWEGIKSYNPWVRKHVEVAVANAIHEAWISRGNVGAWNQGLAIAYINLPVEEQDKDKVHYKMACDMMSTLIKTIRRENFKNNIKEYESTVSDAVNSFKAFFINKSKTVNKSKTAQDESSMEDGM